MRQLMVSTVDDLAGADRVGVALDAEARKEIDALDVDTLVAHQARGEHGIEAPRD